MVSDIPAGDGIIVNLLIHVSTAKGPKIGCIFWPYHDFLYVLYTANSEGLKVVFGTFYGTPTKRQFSKRQVSKRLVSKRLKRQVYKTSGLQNVRFTKYQVYKTSGLQNVRLHKKHPYIFCTCGWWNPQVLLQPCLQAK